MRTPPLPRSLFMVNGSYHPHAECTGCQSMANKAVTIAKVTGAVRGDYGDGTHAARVIRVHLPQPSTMPEHTTPKGV